MNLIISILHKIVSFLLREKIVSKKTNVYIKGNLVGRITIEYSRLLKPYIINKQIEKDCYCKIQDMFSNYIEVFTPSSHFIFVEKRGWMHSACIELFCQKHDKDLIHNRIIKCKLIK